MVAGITIGRCPRCDWRDWPRRFSYGRQVLHPALLGPALAAATAPTACSSGGTSTQITLSRFSTRRVVLVGLGLFLAALALILAALAAAAMALFLAGMVVGGVAVGAIFLGSLATANRLTPPGRRRQTVPAFFVACYAGMIIPVVGIGVLTGFTGTFPAVLAFSLLLAMLSLFSFASIRRTL
jgi:MFS family permease